MPPILQICFGLTLLIATTGLHIVAINISLKRAAFKIEQLRHGHDDLGKMLFVLVYVVFLSLAILVEALIWACAFIALDAVSGFWLAAYFAIVTLTTLGYGDFVPPEGARLLAGYCAIAGLFLVGLSTAFVIEVLRRLEAQPQTSETGRDP